MSRKKTFFILIIIASAALLLLGIIVLKNRNDDIVKVSFVPDDSFADLQAYQYEKEIAALHDRLSLLGKTYDSEVIDGHRVDVTFRNKALLSPSVLNLIAGDMLDIKYEAEDGGWIELNSLSFIDNDQLSIERDGAAYVFTYLINTDNRSKTIPDIETKPLYLQSSRNRTIYMSGTASKGNDGSICCRFTSLPLLGKETVTESDLYILNLIRDSACGDSLGIFCVEKVRDKMGNEISFGSSEEKRDSDVISMLAQRFPNYRVQIDSFSREMQVDTCLSSDPANLTAGEIVKDIEDLFRMCELGKMPYSKVVFKLTENAANVFQVTSRQGQDIYLITTEMDDTYKSFEEELRMKLQEGEYDGSPYRYIWD